MLDPFKIQRTVEHIRSVAKSRPTDRLTILRVQKLTFELYQVVLMEIARGSLDPRSLAIAALKAEKGSSDEE